jgi:hypothetical protein
MLDDLCVIDIGEHDRELVAAQPREVHARFVQRRPGDEVAATQLLLEAVGDRMQQVIAGGVAEGVVDALEVVEIEEQEGDLVMLPTRAQQLTVEVFEEILAIRHAGERVEVRQAPNFPLVELLQGDVADHDDDLVYAARRDPRLVMMDAVRHWQLVYH